MEIIELIIRLIAWLADGGKKKAQARPIDPAEMARQQAEWERRRAEWQEQQRRQAVAALMSGGRVAAPPVVAPQAAQPPRKRRQTLAPASAAIQPKPRTTPATAKAATISRWAQPRTLRSQFILTEVLKPPLSLRKPVSR